MTLGIPVDGRGQVGVFRAEVPEGVTPLCYCVDDAPQTFPRLSSTNEVLSPIHSTYYCY